MQKENDEVEPPSKRVSASFDLINNFNDIVHSAGLKVPTAQKTKPAATKVRFNAADNVFEIDDRPIDDHLFVPTPTASNTFNKLTERRLTDSDLAAENPFLGDFPVGDTDNRANNSKQLWDDDVEFLNSPEHGGRGVSLLLSDAMKEKQKRNENIQPKAFPASIPVSEILTRTSESFPKLTLRNGHPLTYSALISDICRKSVQRSKQSERENKSTVKGDSSPDSLMDYMNTVCLIILLSLNISQLSLNNFQTVCQAARENLEMIRNLPLPTSNSLGTEAPSSADVGGQFTFNLNSSFHLNGNDDDLFLRSSP